MKVDTLVVGAGPGGATAAHELARLGYKVLLVDMKHELGKPVVCGEYMPEYEEIERVFPERAKQTLRRAYSFFRRERITNAVKSITVDVEGEAKNFKFKGFIIAKDQVIVDIAEEAKGLGAKVITGATFVGGRMESNRIISYVRVKGELMRIESESVVGADKYPSIVSRTYGLNNSLEPGDIAYTISQRAVKVEYPEDDVYMLFDHSISPGGYAWIIPRGENVYNIGLGVLGPYARRLMDYYRRFLRLKPFNGSTLSGRPLGKPLPVGGVFKEIAAKGIYLVGDSAGTVMPTNGGGIFTAMMCGIILGEAIDSKGGFNEEAEATYRKRVYEEVGKVIEHGLRLRRAVERVMKRPGVFRRIYRLMPSSIVRDIISGRKTLPTTLISLVGAW